MYGTTRRALDPEIISEVIRRMQDSDLDLVTVLKEIDIGNHYFVREDGKVDVVRG
jgi:hypothetical protein